MDDVDVVRDLEVELLSPAARRSPARLRELLDVDFREIGASGRVWSRAETIELLAGGEGTGPIPHDELTGEVLAPGVVLLTYVSDLYLISTALQPHRGEMGKGAMVTSLDHAIWIHDQPDVGEWLLYVQESPQAANGRTMCRGTIFAADGRHLATVVQEGLLRLGR